MATSRDIHKLEQELQKTLNGIEKELTKKERTLKPSLSKRIETYLNNRKIKRKEAELERMTKMLNSMTEEISEPKNELNNLDIFTKNDNNSDDSTETVTVTKPEIDVIAELRKPIRLCLPNYEISITQY